MFLLTLFLVIAYAVCKKFICDSTPCWFDTDKPIRSELRRVDSLWENPKKDKGAKSCYHFNSEDLFSTVGQIRGKRRLYDLQ